MSESNNKWKGKRAIIVARQSLDKEGTASTAAQSDYMSKDLQRVGMHEVDTIPLDGVRASAPKQIADLLATLIKRKREKNDFDVIAWQVEDRATRGGGKSGMWLEHEANRHGISVFFAGDDGQPQKYGAVVRVVKYEAAMESSVSNSQRTTQGQNWAQNSGFFRTKGHTPMGCDRLYFGSDDQPKFIIHNLQNGLQEQVDWNTRAVIGQYGSIGKKSRNRFRKQRNEYSLLIAGDRQQRQTVRVIFYLRYKRGWHGFRIADFLNRTGTPAPMGGSWAPRQVESIYENEAYTGVSFNNQTYSGRFFRRDKSLGFVALNRDECELAIRKTFTPKLVPMAEWDRIDQPYMYDFLPRDVRDLAIVAQAKLWSHRSDPDRVPRTVNAHPTSDYLLSGKLRARQDEQEYLVGTLSGPKGRKTPYYRHPKGKRELRKGGIFGNLIPCLPLHNAVLDVVGQSLCDAPELRDRLHQHVIDQRNVAGAVSPDVAALEAERDEIKQMLQLIMRSLTGAALKDAGAELQRLSDRRNAVETQLATAKQQRVQDHRPVEQVVEEAIQVLCVQRERLASLPKEPLRDAIDLLIAEAWVDMETKAVELKLNLPVWALAPEDGPDGNKQRNPLRNDAPGLCPPASRWSSTGGWTQAEYLAFKCEYEWRRGSHDHPPCYRCQRMAA